MSNAQALGLDNTAAVPIQVAPVQSDIDNGTLEHTHDPRAHAYAPTPLPMPALLVDNDQECRVHNPTVPSAMAGESDSNHLSDRTLSY